LPLRSMTGETITDEGELAAQLKAVRDIGIALEQEEALIGECALILVSQLTQVAGRAERRPPPERVVRRLHALIVARDRRRLDPGPPAPYEAREPRRHENRTLAARVELDERQLFDLASCRDDGPTRRTGAD